MSKRYARIPLAAAAAALAATLGVTTALAATSWTVTPGEAFSGKSPLKLGQVTCSSAIKGTFRGGTGPGKHIGSVTSLALSTCTGPLGLTFVVTAGALPWFLNATSYNSGTGVTTGKLTGVHLSLSGQACSLVADGTSGAADNGKVTFTYTNSSHKLTFGPSGSLHTWNVSGCAGLFTNGGAISMSASYVISPAQTITSP